MRCRRRGSDCKWFTELAVAIAGVFEAHAAFLRPVISRAESDAVLLADGATESRRLLGRVAAAIAVAPAVGEAIARTLYAECVVRTMYGARFFSDRPETADAFERRIGRVAAALATISSADAEDRRSRLP